MGILMSLALELSLTRQDSVMFDIIKGSRCGSCPTGRPDLLSGSSETFVLRHNYCHVSDTSSFLQRFLSLEAAAAVASLQGSPSAPHQPPPLPPLPPLPPFYPPSCWQKSLNLIKAEACRVACLLPSLPASG